MQWTPSLAVGVELIDKQHRELFARVDSFHEAMKAKKDQAEILKMLDFMLNYTVTHFKAEEDIQRKHLYPKYLDHKKLHDDFIKEIKTLKSNLETNGVTVGTNLLVGSTLSNWLVSHVSVQDKALGEFIQSKAG